MPLIAVVGDPNTHAGGNLIAANPNTVFAGGVPVIEHDDPALPDALCPPLGGPHCQPGTVNGSPTVFVYGKPVHRHRDLRRCGATTIVINQSTVYANGS